MWFFALGVAVGCPAVKNVTDIYVPSLGARALDALLDASLSRIVVRFPKHATARYFTILTKDDEVWIAFKTGSWPHADANETVWLATGCDAALRSSSQSCLESRVRVPMPEYVAHNVALTVDGDGLWGVGGKSLIESGGRATPTGGALELWASRREVVRGAIHFAPAGIDETSAGCVERRTKYAPKCQYDGRFSLCQRHRDVFLYARANTNPRGGGRHVSVARLASKRPLTWSPFELVSFLPGDDLFSRILANPSLAMDHADIYTASVSHYAGVLLGFFSTGVALPKDDGGFDFHAAILFAVSCNGHNFSAPLPLVAAISTGTHGEINDHVVDGLVRTSDNNLYLYVHHGVAGTFQKHNIGCSFLEQDKHLHHLPSSHIARYAFQLTQLHRHIKQARDALRAAGTCPENTARRRYHF